MLPLLTARIRSPLLFDLDDLVHRVHWRDATTGPFRLGKIGDAAQVPAILHAERKAVILSNRTFVCSKADKDFVARLGAKERAVVLPNAVPLPSDAPRIGKEKTVLFIGNYAYEPNLAAAERLVKYIWPLVIRSCPDARLLLAGPGLDRLPGDLIIPESVERLGFVSDLDDLYNRTRVVCCPLRVGGGTRLKLIEAAGYARPIVSTRIGAEGLLFTEDTEIILRDDDLGLATACVDLMSDNRLCERLGAAARIKAAAHYDAHSVSRQVSAIVRSVLTGTDYISN